MRNIQIGIHLLKCGLGLGEEVKDDGLGKLALLFVIVHLEDLLKDL